MAGNRVGNYLQDHFGFRLATKQVNISATGDVGFFAFTVNQTTLRKIRVRTPSGNVAAGALGIWTLPGQSGINIAANATLSNLTGPLTFQELALTAAANSAIMTSTTNYYVNVGTAVAGATVFIDLYGDPITTQL